MEKMQKQGLFIDFEGGEKVGKTTQLKRSADYLCSLGFKVLETREPGGGDPKIREKLLYARSKNLTGEEELDLFCEDRRLHVANVIKPALERGEIVLCDRFEPSSVAYQGYGRGIDLNLIRRKSGEARQGIWPDLIIFFDGNPEMLLKREALTTRFDQESLDFHNRVRQGFLEIAKADFSYRSVINAELLLEEVWQNVKACLDNFLNNKPGMEVRGG